MLVCVLVSCLFLVALWSLAGKGQTSCLSCVLCFLMFPKCFLVHISNKGGIGAVKLVKALQYNILLIVPRRYFFVDRLLFFCLVFAMPFCACIYLHHVVTCWERADLLALVCGVYL